MEVGIGRLPVESDPLRTACPGRAVFESVTNRWTLLILWSLKDAPLRFFRIRDRVEGISERVLSQNLKSLCRSGLIERHVEHSTPPKVSYSLTPIGSDLLSVVDVLTDWIADKLPAIIEAQKRFDAAQSSG